MWGNTFYQLFFKKVGTSGYRTTEMDVYLYKGKSHEVDQAVIDMMTVLTCLRSGASFKILRGIFDLIQSVENSWRLMPYMRITYVCPPFYGNKLAAGHSP